jgi:hypothetical protein
MTTIEMDFADDDRQSRLWIAQHPNLVGIVQFSAMIITSVILWGVIIGVGRLAWGVIYVHVR